MSLNSGLSMNRTAALFKEQKISIKNQRKYAFLIDLADYKYFNINSDISLLQDFK
jgi:hypothetical protein